MNENRNDVKQLQTTVETKVETKLKEIKTEILNVKSCVDEMQMKLMETKKQVLNNYQSHKPLAIAT